MATDNEQNNDNKTEKVIEKQNIKADKDVNSLTTSEIISANYAILKLPIFLFLLIALFVLGYHYVMANKITQLKQSADLAVRQEILLQKIATEVMQVERLNRQQKAKQAQPISDELILATKQLEKSMLTFDNTLNAFANGGELVHKTGENIQLKNSSNTFVVNTIYNTQTLWQPYQGLLENIISSVKTKNVNDESIAFASDYTRIFNGKLLREVSDLQQFFVKKAKYKSHAMKRTQMIAFILMILLCLYAILKILRQFSEKDNQLVQHRKQSNEILAMVKEGLFLIDKDLVISEEYSQALEDILQQKNLAGKTLNHVLSPIISNKDLETTKIFIEQLYSDWVLEELINDLNPLHKIQVQIPAENGGFVERYLDFKFSRVYDGEKISQILVHVYDITEAVLLEKSLEQEIEQNNKQLVMLSNIMNGDDNLLQSFIQTTYNRIENINNILKIRGSQLTELHNKLEDIYCEVHSLKGEASSLNLAMFVELIERTESQINELLNKADLVGNDFLSLTIHLEELLQLTIFVDNLTNRMECMGQTDNHSTTLSPFVENAVNMQSSINMKAYYTNFAHDIAQRHNKEISFQCIGIDSIALSQEQENLIKDISIQLLRNAIVHGIELPDEREQHNKSRVGNLTLRLQENKGVLALSMTDDGRGIDYEKIRQTALNSGKYSPETVESWKEKDLLQLLFTTGFSTAETQDEDAGRGIGMQIIKSLVKQLDGRLKIGSEENLYTRFTITFPRQP